MQAKDIMTASPACCTPADTLQDVARLMRDSDCGAIPVVDGAKVVGIVTDRDLAVRGLADGMSAEASISDVLTRDPKCCRETDDVKEVQRVMSDHQVRRVPIINADGAVVGIVAQADLARASEHLVSEHEVAIVVERISEPANTTGTGADMKSSESRM